MLNIQEKNDLIYLLKNFENYDNFLNLINTNIKYSFFLHTYSEERNQLLLDILEFHFKKNLDKNFGILRSFNINAKDYEFGHNFLHWLALNSKRLNLPEDFTNSIVNSIVKVGGEINAVNLGGATPLHIASSYENKFLIETLLNNSAKITKNKFGKTCLHVLQDYKKLSEINYNFKTQDLDIQDSKGKTVIFYAIKNRDIKGLNYLLGKVDVNIINKKNKTPLDYAIELDEKSIVNILKYNGAKTYEALKNANKGAVNYILNDENASASDVNIKNKRPAFFQEKLQYKKQKYDSFVESVQTENAEKEVIKEIQNKIKLYEEYKIPFRNRAIAFNFDPVILQKALNKYFRNFQGSYEIIVEEVNFLCFHDIKVEREFKKIFNVQYNFR